MVSAPLDSPFLAGLHEYRSFTGEMSVMAELIGTFWSRFLELRRFAALLVVCWRERRHTENTDHFALTLSSCWPSPSSSSLPTAPTIKFSDSSVAGHAQRTPDYMASKRHQSLSVRHHDWPDLLGRGFRRLRWRAFRSFCRGRRSSVAGPFLFGHRSRFPWSVAALMLLYIIRIRGLFLPRQSRARRRMLWGPVPGLALLLA